MHPFFARAAAAISLVAAASAIAQPAIGLRPCYLQPSAFSAPVGAPITVRLESLEAAPQRSIPWPQNIRWLLVRSPGFQENRSQDDAPRPVVGASGIQLPLEHPGLTVIGLDLPARATDLSLPIVRSLASPSAAGADEPDKIVRATLIESAKAIVQATDAQTDSTASVATGKTGQAVEIRPLMDPASTPIGSDIALRVYVGGDAARDGVLRAIHTATGTDRALTIKPGGFSVLHLSAAGQWHLAYQCARRAEAGQGTDWTIYSATLTFQTQEAPPPPPPPPSPSSVEAPR